MSNATKRLTSGFELLTTTEMAEADRLAVAAGVPSLTLMENAGRAVADEAARMVTTGARIHVFCGPGNNGGDGFVAARLLAERGYRVTLGLFGERGTLKGDAAQMAARWTGPVANAFDFEAGKIDLYIDALFGAGLSRPLDDAVGSDILTRISDDDLVLAVDVPSGLDGNTGQPTGPVFKASRTVTFFRKKPGHVLMPGRALCGEVVVADIGIPGDVLTRIAGKFPMINASATWLPWLPRLDLDGHKYTRGHAVVVSGPAEQTGAARMSARGALRVGAGLVTVASPPDAVATNAAHLTAIMLKRFDGPRGLAEILSDERKNAVLIGPGCGVSIATRLLVQVALEFEAAAVLDADALTAFTLDQDDDEQPVV